MTQVQALPIAGNVVQVCRRDVYGQTLAYPVCDKARTFASLVGRKTLTARDMEHIRALGYRVALVPQV
jgi:histone H3/H4